MTNAGKLLKRELADLIDAGRVLKYSYDKCRKVPVGSGMTAEALESYEALTSRFARLSDIIIQKVLRSMEIIDLEETGSVRDRINRAEKKGFIASADAFVEIRTLRNEIAHGYQTETILAIFEKVVALTPELLESIDSISACAAKYLENE